MAGALDGIRVVSFGHFVAGPMAAMFLADQGADVLSIERPGAPSHGPAAWRRGQRRLALDLKSPARLAQAREAALEADVVVENFRPGVLQRLGLGPETLRASARISPSVTVPIAQFTKLSTASGSPSGTLNTGWCGGR